ncbi:uncharacterized protein LOC144879594 [Branchiostoma floridae x Branchiostoma japonicum]
MGGKAVLLLALWPWWLMTSFVQLASTAAMLPLTILASLIHATFVLTTLTYTLLHHAMRPAGFLWASMLDIVGCRQDNYDVEDNDNLQKSPRKCLLQQLLDTGKSVLSAPLRMPATVWFVSRHGLCMATSLAFYYPIVVPVRAVASATEKAVSRLVGYLWSRGPGQQLVVREALQEEVESVTKMLEHDRAQLLLPAQLHFLATPDSVAAMLVIGGVVNYLLHSEPIAILAALTIWVGVVQANLSWYLAQEEEQRNSERRLSRHLVAVYKNRVQGVVRLVAQPETDWDVSVIKEITWVENERFDVPGTLLNFAETQVVSRGEIRASLCELEMRKLGVLTAHGFHHTQKGTALSIFPGMELENYELSKNVKC